MSNIFSRAGKWISAKIPDLLKRVLQEYGRDNGALLAAAISFYAVLSIFPLLLVAIAIYGFVLGDGGHEAITSAAEEFIVGGTAQSVIQQVVEGSIAATGIGIVLLLWSGTSVVVAMQMAMNLVWNLEQHRGALKQRLVALLFLLLMGTLLLISVGITGVVNYIMSAGQGLIPGWSWVATLFSYLVPAVVSIAAFTLVYKVLPNTHVRTKAALVGGTAAGILWELAKHGFTYYVVNFAQYNQVYGSLGGAILLLVWIYYTGMIAVLGGELASLWASEHPEPGSEDAKRPV